MQAVSVGGELLEVVPVRQTYIAILHEKSKSKGGRANLEYLDDLIKCLTGEEISLYQTHYPSSSSTKITVINKVLFPHKLRGAADHTPRGLTETPH